MGKSLILPLLIAGGLFAAGEREAAEIAQRKCPNIWGLLARFGIPTDLDQRATPIVQKTWNVIVYLAADNNLHDEALNNLEQMKSIGSNAYMNILAYLDITDDQQGKVGIKLFVDKNNISIIGQEPNADSGSADTFANFVLWALKTYPSQRVAIILWNHGAGDLSPRSLFPRVGICFDDTCGTYLDDQKLISAFDRIFKARKNKKIDIVLFDACLMAGTATAWLMSPYADYMIASEETVPGNGFPYDTFLKPFAKGTVDCSSLAKSIVNCYKACYGPRMSDYTCSAFALNANAIVAQNIDTVAHLLVDAIKLQKNNSVNKMIKSARNKKVCLAFSEPGYADLMSLYINLLAGINTLDLGDKAKTATMKTNLQKALKDGIAAIKNMVIANACGDTFRNAGGLSIFFPETKSSDPTYASYSTTEFAKNN